MNVTGVIIIFIWIIGYLLLKYQKVVSENKLLKKQKTNAENSTAFYFNQFLQYRDIIIKNNINIPGDYTQPNIKDEKIFKTDDILDEIAEKGIDNISKDKLDFLNKQNGKIS